MIYELMFFLVIFLVVIYAFNNRDLIEPSFLFCTSFCFATTWAAVYAKRWDLNLHRNTFFVILGGVAIFFGVSFITKNILNITKRNRVDPIKNEFKVIEVEIWKKILFLLISIFTILYTIYFIINITNGSWKNISESINTYRRMTIFADRVNIVFPRMLSYLRYAVNAMGYWFIYIVINNYLIEKKIDKLSLGVVVCSAVSGMVTGGRGYAIYIILAGIVITILFLNKKNGFRAKIDFKTLAKFMCVCFIIIFAFKTTGTMLGKVATSKKSINSFGFFDYLAVYCGAEIKNLDIYLRERLTIIRTKNNIFGSQTFINLIKWFGPSLGISNTNYSLDLPFRMVNGFNLGNVYTTFYPYIYDFGYKGVIIMTGIMSLIAQFIYEKCKRVKLTDVPSINILIYSYIFNTLIFSFFSNKFYELILSKQFAYTIILWFIYNIFLCKFKIKKRTQIY